MPEKDTLSRRERQIMDVLYRLDIGTSGVIGIGGSLADHAIDWKAVAGNNMGSWSNNGWPVQRLGGICGALLHE